MARWHDEFQNHAVHAQLALLKNGLDDLDPPDTADAVEELQRVVQIVEVIGDALDKADPGLVRDRPNLLNQILTMVNNVIGQINAYANSATVNHLIQAGIHAEVALAFLPQLVAAAPQPSASVSAQATTFRRKVGQYISSLDTEAEEAREEFVDLKTSLSAAETRVTELEAELAAKLVEWDARFQDSQNERITAFSDLQTEELERSRASLDKEREGQAESHQTVQAAQEMQQDQQEEKLEALLTKWEASRVTAMSEADATLLDLERLLDSAREQAGMISETGLSGRYNEAAERNQKSANRLMGFGIAAGVALAVGAGWLFFEKAPEIASVAESLRRSVLIALASAIPVYLLRESSDRRDTAAGYRQLHVELASFGLFLAELPEDDRSKLRKDAVARYFKGREGITRRDKAKVYQSPAGAVVSDVIDTANEQ